MGGVDFLPGLKVPGQETVGMLKYIAGAAVGIVKLHAVARTGIPFRGAVAVGAAIHGPQVAEDGFHFLGIGVFAAQCGLLLSYLHGYFGDQFAFGALGRMTAGQEQAQYKWKYFAKLLHDHRLFSDLAYGKMTDLWAVNMRKYGINYSCYFYEM